MDRKQFINELAFLLQDIDEIERSQAIEYYEAYFDDAGVENEAQVIADLGSPERVAAIIKAGLEDKFDQDIEYSESRMDNSNYDEKKDIIDAKTIEKDESSNNNHHFKGDPDRNKILLIAIIIGAILLALPIGGGIFGISLGVFGGIFGILMAVFFGGIACLAGAVGCFVKGFIIMAATPGAGLILLAAGFGLIALSFLFFAITRGAIVIIPKIFRVIVNAIRKLVNKVGDNV